MGNTIIQYTVTGIANKCVEEMLVDFHPNLITTAKIIITKEDGTEVVVIVEDIEIVHAEDFDE